MDGCLLDTERMYIKAWGMAFQAKGIPITREQLIALGGKGTVHIDNFMREYTHSGEMAKALRASREEFFWGFLDRGEVGLMPYAGEILKYVKSTNLLLGIASSTYTQKASRILMHFDLLHSFDFKVFGDMIENLKPAPDIYNMAVSLSGKTKEECITFEDSATGVMAANACGIDVVYVPGIGERVSEDAAVYREIPSLREGVALLAGLI